MAGRPQTAGGFAGTAPSRWRLVILDVEHLPIRRHGTPSGRKERMPAPAEIAFREFLVKRGAVHLPLLGKLYPAEGIVAEG